VSTLYGREGGGRSGSGEGGGHKTLRSQNAERRVRALSNAKHESAFHKPCAKYQPLSSEKCVHDTLSGSLGNLQKSKRWFRKLTAAQSTRRVSTRAFLRRVRTSLRLRPCARAFQRAEHTHSASQNTRTLPQAPSCSTRGRVCTWSHLSGSPVSIGDTCPAESR
jgi:hypothetical protein